MNPTIHDLVAQSQELTNQIILAEGELTPELEAKLAEVDLAVASKVDVYADVIERLNTEADYWDAQALIRQKLAKGLRAAAQFKKDTILGAMKAMGKEEVLGVERRFKVMNASQKKLTIDEIMLPESYKMQKIEWVADKERIRADLEAGKEIEGCALVQGQYVRPFMNKGGKK